jgi:hypothetical protein
MLAVLIPCMVCYAHLFSVLMVQLPAEPSHIGEASKNLQLRNCRSLGWSERLLWNSNQQGRIEVSSTLSAIPIYSCVTGCCHLAHEVHDDEFSEFSILTLGQRGMHSFPSGRPRIGIALFLSHSWVHKILVGRCVHAWRAIVVI